MQPTFNENDEVLVSSIPLKLRNPKIGDVVVFEKSKKYYIKRVKSIKGDKYYLQGDNKSDSKDSRKFGSIPKSRIKGKVIVKL